MTRTADTDTVLLVSLADFSNGVQTVPAGSMGWRVNGMGGAWTPFTTTSSTIDATAAPGTVVRSYDVRIDVPAAQAPGAYTSTMTWTAVATP